MDAPEVLNTTEVRLASDSGRAAKPRSAGITMVLTFDIANYGPAFVAPFSHLVDKVKIMDTLWHDDPDTLATAVKAYRDLGISVSCGGTQFEIALAQGSVDDYVSMLADLGITEVEVEHHADTADAAQMAEEVAFFKERGFTVIGEVGKKWAWRDDTRTSRDLVSVDNTVAAINSYVEAGADWIYWEGAVVGGLIGRQLENKAGQQQLRDVASQVDAGKLIFEVYDRRNQPLYPMIAWLVGEFGPNVNLANIEPWLVKRVEWIRHGVSLEFDHPYMRWKADPSVAPNWWNLPETPDYAVDIQRPFAFVDTLTEADNS